MTQYPRSPSPPYGEGYGIVEPSKHLEAVANDRYDDYEVEIWRPIPDLARFDEMDDTELAATAFPEAYENSYEQLSRDGVEIQEHAEYVMEMYDLSGSQISEDDYGALVGTVREREWMVYWDDVDHTDIDIELLREEYPWLFGRLVQQPLVELNSAELALRVWNDDYSLEIGFENIPRDMTRTVESLRADDLNSLVFVDVRVSHRSSVKPSMYLLEQICDTCGDVHSMWQRAFQDIERLDECASCGGRLTDEEQYISTQDIKLQDLHTRVNRSNPAELASRLKRSDVRSVESGEIVRLALVVRADDSKDKKHPEMASEVAGIQRLDERFDDIEVSDEERDRIEEVAEREDVHDALAESIAPSIAGGEEYDLARLAALYQMASGVRQGPEPAAAQQSESSDARRGVIHVGYIGDPSTAKSSIARAAHRIAPKSEFVNADASGSTSVGLTASVTQEETFDKTEWVVSGGALPRANEGLAVLDELDKASKTQKDSLNIPLSNQVVSVNKADISTTLSCKTSVLMVANPDEQRFKLHDPVTEQIPLPPTLFDRMDVIIPFIDRPDEEHDREVAQTLSNNSGGEFDETFLRKYISVAREYEPELTDDANQMLEERYVELRQKSERKDGRVTVSPRNLHAMRRCAQASAKLRLSDRVTAEDAQRGIDVVESALRLLATNQFGELDADRVTSGPSARQRDVMEEMVELVEGLSPSGSPVDEAAVLEEAENHDISASEALSAIKRSSELWKNQHGVGVVNDG